MDSKKICTQYVTFEMNPQYMSSAILYSYMQLPSGGRGKNYLRFDKNFKLKRSISEVYPETRICSSDLTLVPLQANCVVSTFKQDQKLRNSSVLFWLSILQMHSLQGDASGALDCVDNESHQNCKLYCTF